MTIEDQIAALLAEAEPLRLLPDEDAEAKGLPRIVDAINALRALQTSGVTEVEGAPQEKRKPGRPPKAKPEGADA